MAVLPEKCCHSLKNMADPLFFVCLTNQHTPSGQVIGNGLVLALPGKERGGDERDIIEFRLADRSRWSAELVGKCHLFHRLVCCMSSRASRAMCT